MNDKPGMKAKAAKRKGKALPVKAWEKLKGRGPFPQVALDDEFKKQMSEAGEEK